MTWFVKCIIKFIVEAELSAVVGALAFNHASSETTLTTIIDASQSSAPSPAQYTEERYHDLRPGGIIYGKRCDPKAGPCTTALQEPTTTTALADEFSFTAGWTMTDIWSIETATGTEFNISQGVGFWTPSHIGLVAGVAIGVLMIAISICVCCLVHASKSSSHSEKRRTQTSTTTTWIGSGSKPVAVPAQGEQAGSCPETDYRMSVSEGSWFGSGAASVGGSGPGASCEKKDYRASVCSTGTWDGSGAGSVAMLGNGNEAGTYGRADYRVSINRDWAGSRPSSVALAGAGSVAMLGNGKEAGTYERKDYRVSVNGNWAGPRPSSVPVVGAAVGGGTYERTTTEVYRLGGEAHFV